MSENKSSKVFKYNQDDILEILIERLGEELELDSFLNNAVIVGTLGEDLRLIAAVGDEDNSNIGKLKLFGMDKN